MKQNFPKVSVCIVTYNQEQYLADCLQSVVEQFVDFPIEVIVSDDCSIDKTREIIKEFADKYDFIKPVFRSENVGALKNYVSTHFIASGVYVCHLDGDDTWNQGKLKAQVDFLDENPEYSVCWSLANLFNDAGDFSIASNECLKVFKNGEVDIYTALRFGAVAVNSSMMYRRNFFPKIDFNRDYIDVFISWSLLENGRGKILSEDFVNYRVNAKGAITRNSNIKKLYLEHGISFFNKSSAYKESLNVFFITNFLIAIKTLSFRDVIGFGCWVIRSLNRNSLKNFYFHLSCIGKINTRI